MRTLRLLLGSALFGVLFVSIVFLEPDARDWGAIIAGAILATCLLLGDSSFRVRSWRR